MSDAFLTLLGAMQKDGYGDVPLIGFEQGDCGKPPTGRPCAECPFRRTSVRGWLGGAGPRQYLLAAHSDQDIPCHMDPAFKRGLVDQSRSCSGLAIYRRHVLKTPRAGSALTAVQRVQECREEVFAHPAEFLEHHTVRSWDDLAARNHAAQEHRARMRRSRSP